MPTAVPDVITRYFEADARRDIDAIVALFTDDAVVVDEGETWRGIAEIRAWRLGPASRYQYTTHVSGTGRSGDDEYLVTGSLTGNFPGGTAELVWRFTVASDSIRRLQIAP
jgi:uncharacterized protein (TIGR02246 family)